MLDAVRQLLHRMWKGTVPPVRMERTCCLARGYRLVEVTLPERIIEVEKKYI